MATSRRSFAHQTLHYFARPHQAPRMEPVTSREAWTAASLVDDPWLVELTGAEQDACIAAVERAMATGVPVDRWTRDIFHIPELAASIPEWVALLDGRGRGFHVIRGVPVDRMTTEQAEAFFWGLGLLLGVPGGQNTDGDLLGHVTDLGDTEPGRLYRTADNIRFHCDAADVVGLLCLATPKSGGESRLASSASVYNAILAQRPDLIPRLYAPFEMDAHGQRGMTTMRVPSARHAAGRLRIFWHSDYFRTGGEKTGGLDPETRELIELFDTLADSDAYSVSMQLRRGDVQLVSNHSVVHSRRAYEDHAEVGKRRHLLRLWLSLPTEQNLASRLRKASAWRRAVGALVGSRLRSRG